MSPKRDDSELPMSEPVADDDAVFDHLARRAGAALRRPAPDDGVRVITARRRRQQALKATVVGGAAVVSVIGALAVIAVRDGGDRSPQVDSPPATLPATTTPAPMTTRAPTQTSLPVDSSPATVAPPPSGEEITVSADFVEFGDGLVGLIGNMDRADGRTYVIAGRYETEEDLLRAPDEAVLAAFDDAGQELWRTELDGSPIGVVAVAGDVWVRHEAGMSETLSRVDASNGRVVDQVPVGNVTEMFGAFGSVWVQTGDSPFSGQLVRVDPDLSTTTVELPDRVFSENADPWPDSAAAGPDGIWVPLGEAGVAVIDPDTVEVTVIPADEIGHDVQKVGFDGDVVYVASLNQVTSIVDGQVRSTTSPGQIQYLGPMDGDFGVQLPDGRFEVLTANDPIVVEHRHVATVAIPSEIDGEAWVETGRNFNLRRVELLAGLSTTSLPAPTTQTSTTPTTSAVPAWSGPAGNRGDLVHPMVAGVGGLLTWQDPLDAAVDWVDVTGVAFSPEDQAHWSIELAAKPPLAADREPGLLIAYGLALETTGDGVADYVVGVDNNVPRPGDFRVWVTDLATGETDEQIGPPYGFPVEFVHPDESQPDGLPGPPSVDFTFLGSSKPTDLNPETVRFAAWTSVTRDGEVVAWDYAPDTGWVSPDAP